MSTTSTRPLQPPCAHMHPLHTRPNFSRAAGHFGWRRVLLLALGPSTPLLSASSRPARVVAPLQATSKRCTSCSRSRVESANTTSSMASGRKWPIFPCIGSSVTFTSSVVCRPCVQRSHSTAHDFCRPVRSRLLHAHPPWRLVEIGPFFHASVRRSHSRPAWCAGHVCSARTARPVTFVVLCAPACCTHTHPWSVRCAPGKKKDQDSTKRQKRTAASRIPAWSPTAVLTRRYRA